MEYAVGIYKIVPPKPFPSFEKAVEYIQEKYPELDIKTIEKHLMPKITSNGKDQSGDICEENSIGNQSDTQTSSAGTKRIKPSSDKSG